MEKQNHKIITKLTLTLATLVLQNYQQLIVDSITYTLAKLVTVVLQSLQAATLIRYSQSLIRFLSLTSF